MPDTFMGNTLRKKLFLICPTDSIEQLVRNDFMGEAVFFTALGVYFEFELEMQFRLWDLICENSIDQVIFVSTINNVFYIDAFQKEIRHNYPVDRVLANARNKISKDLVPLEVFSSSFHLLITRYLTNQKNRLLSTSYLGSRLKEEKIDVKAFVYQPQENFFYCLQRMERRGYLFEGISYN